MFGQGFGTSNFDKLLDKATNSKEHLEPNWALMLQLCDLIRQTDVQPKYAIRSIKKKLANDSPHVILLALRVLESWVKNCGTLIHDEIGTKEFMEYLKDSVKGAKNETVKTKYLELIQTWAHAFRNSSKYTAVRDTLNIMKQEGYKFPALNESDAMFSADTAPPWTDGKTCHRCRVQFGTVTRKHHCRNCGQVFCNQCSDRTSTLPKYGIEKEVRVCEKCYEQINKPTTTQTKDTDLPVEYLNSSLAQQQQVPPSKSTKELQEEEDLQLALALSQSEAEQKEKEKKRQTMLKSNPAPTSRSAYSPPPSPTTSPSRLQDEDEVDPELAKYLNRKYWEQRQTIIEEHGSRSDVTSPSAPNISSPMPQRVVIPKQQNGEFDNQMEEFVNTLRTQLEIFVNRMKSNSSRGRSIANDTSVQSLFMNITDMHSRLLKYIQEQDDSRVYYEGLQDKLTQIKDARAALDALREEHREKLRRQAEEAERQRQMLMAQKLSIMRKKKQEYLQYQRQLALQKIQEQEREMQMRQEQQKQQYILGGYQAASGYLGPSQGSPVHHVQYQGPGSNYNPMSPTGQGAYIYGQPSMNQYPLQNYNLPMSSLPAHMMAPMLNEDRQPPDASVQGRETLGRVTTMGAPGMLPPQMPNPMQQLQQPPHMGPPVQQGGPPGHIPPSTQAPPGPMSTQQGPAPQIAQSRASAQMGLPPQVQPGHLGPSAQMAPGPHGPHGPPGAVVVPPPQIGPQQPGPIPTSQGPPMQHVPNPGIPPQTSTGIQMPQATATGPMQPANQPIQGHQVVKLEPINAQPINEETRKEPETAELISFD